jgi:hypothetical protein
MKLLFICKKRVSQYGICVGLDNSAQFLVNHFQEQNIPCKMVSVMDSNAIDKEVFEYKPTHVIIHALWVPAYKFIELLNKRRYKNIKWIVRIHSKIPFLANEGIAIQWLQEYKKIQKTYPNLIISANSKAGNNALSKALQIKSVYLPNIYKPSYCPAYGVTEKNVVNIACFGAIRPLKNQLIQAMAAIEYGNKYNKTVHFHVNGTRTEQKGDVVLKNIQALFVDSRHKLIQHEWKSHEDFLDLISTMNIGMQVSLTETFNIVAADFVYCGKPVVVSDEIEWVSGWSKASCHDIDSIVRVMRRNLKFNIISILNFFRLGWNNYKASKVWLKYLNHQQKG